MRQLFAFIACRDFYVTCERNYNPSLEGKPLVLLDANDCIHALSSEAKELGLQKGVPMFLHASTIRAQKIAVYRVNDLLCQDMTTRLQGMLSTFASDIECWSVDQLFLDVFCPEAEDWLDSIAEQLKATIKLGTGMVSHVGVAPTRTLAHLAARMGIHDFTDPKLQEYVFGQIGVGSIWGISPTYRELLNASGIFSVLDFRDAEDRVIREIMGVTGIRLALELRNISCFTRTDFPAFIPELLSWQRLIEPITTFAHLQTIITQMVAGMAQQLQGQHLSARLMAISLFAWDSAHASQTILLKFPLALDSPQELIRQALGGLSSREAGEFSYGQLRIVLAGLSSPTPMLTSIPTASESTMRRMDGVNARMGSSAVEIASAGMQQLQHSRVTRRLSLPFYASMPAAST